MADRPDAILIAGPTASGKSRLALEMAQAVGGVIVNADASQVYHGLRILTARPDDADLAKAEHHLYGHVDPGHAYSVAEWLGEMRPLLAELQRTAKIPVITGGTGLYFKALLEGLAEIPEPDAKIRAYWRSYSRNAPEALHDELKRRDPVGAELLRPSDTQRLVRALEIHDSTGEPLSFWQARPSKAVLPNDAKLTRFVVEPPRAVLHERIDSRLDAMIEAGALEEVRVLLERNLPPAVPAMKAIGVRQLGGVLRGELALQQALDEAKAATRQYAKRQSTWFRNQTGDDWQRLTGIPPNFS